MGMKKNPGLKIFCGFSESTGFWDPFNTVLLKGWGKAGG